MELGLRFTRFADIFRFPTQADRNSFHYFQFCQTLMNCEDLNLELENLENVAMNIPGGLSVNDENVLIPNKD